MENTHETTSLEHHGIKGMKWGVRRYQNKDGSLTALGEKRMKTTSGIDKKTREDLKDRRVSRVLNAWRQRQDMRQDKLDRENNRAIERAKIKLAQQKARDDSADQALNRKVIKEKLRQEKAAQKQDALDRATERKLANTAAKTQQTLPDEEYYDLPDTPERQSASKANGKKAAGAALAVVGTVALAAAAAKYGPDLMRKLKSVDWSKASKTAKDAAKNAADNREDYADFASEIFKEASAYQGQRTQSFTTTMASVGNVPLMDDFIPYTPKDDK